jgi:DNA polymerase III alpha subunit
MKVFKFPCGCKVPIRHDLPAVHGHPALTYNVEEMPLDCPAVWDLICSGRTKGVFQLESGLGKQWAKKAKPRSIEELSDLIAILRPGTLKSKSEHGISMTELYCRRKNGEMPVEYPIPALESILGKTYGVMVYQEQAIAIASQLAGFNLQEADTLRKAIGKKDTEIMSKTRKLFLEKAKEAGKLTEEEAITVFDNIEKSQRYQFNLAHSVAYAINAYYTAHYKAHFPLYFYTSYLRVADDKQDPMKEIKALVNDAKSFNIEVLPPRFNDLRKHFGTPDGVRVYFGLADVAKIGETKVDKLRAAVAASEKEISKPRDQWSWYEFLTKFSDNIDKTTIENMIRAGALRDLGLPRQLLLAEYDAYNRLSEGERKKIATLDQPLYGTVDVKESVEYDKPVYDKAEWKAYKAQLKLDKDGVITPNPIGTKKATKKVTRKETVLLDEPRHADNLKDMITHLLERPKAVGKGRRSKVAGILKMLESPPFKLEDTPHTIAKMEEETLGVPITYTHVSTVDKRGANTTCRAFRLGEDPRGTAKIAMCVEAIECNEITIRNGDSRGKLMAKMTVSDDTGSIDGVTLFAKAYEKYGHFLQRPNNVITIVGKRDRKDETTLIVDEVFET